MHFRVLKGEAEMPDVPGGPRESKNGERQYSISYSKSSKLQCEPSNAVCLRCGDL